MTKRTRPSEAALGRRIGYARVSTGRQTTDPQKDALDRYGCAAIFEDVASGAARERPQLEACLASLVRGDLLVVYSLDRLARSVIHLAEIVEALAGRGIGFTTIKEGIDTSTASGTLAIHILASIAEFERQLIRERTRFSLAHLKAEGRQLGSPKNRDPETKAKMSATRRQSELAHSVAVSKPWIGMIRTFRPEHSWKIVCAAINDRHFRDRRLMRQHTLLRHVRRLVDGGHLPSSVLTRSTSASADARTLAKRLAEGHDAPSLREIGATLDAVGLHPPRATSWSAETVKRLIERSEP